MLDTHAFGPSAARTGSRWSCAVVGCVLLALAACAWCQPSPSVPEDAPLRRLDEAVALLETLRTAIDRTTFDIDALSATLVHEDAAGIAAWVEREIAFEPYAGVLRGARGSLMARAGNALDQALLLSELLQAAGHEVRVAFTELDDVDTVALLRRALVPRATPPTAGDLGAMAEALATLAALFGLPSTAFDRGLHALSAAPTVDDAALLSELAVRHDELRSALASSGVALGATAAARLRDEARAYAWVEARGASGEPWTAYHPTGLDPVVAPVATAYLDAALLAELQHRVRLDAWIEREVDGATQRVYVMETLDLPVSDLAGTVLDYTHVPDGFVNVPVAEFDLDAVLAATTYYVPYLRGRLAPGALAFDLGGATASPDVALGGAPPAAALVERAASAFGALGGGDAAPSPGVLTAHGLDITLVTPDGRETTHRRWRWRAPRASGDEGPLRDPVLEVGHALMRHDSIVVVAGALPPGFLLDEVIAYLLDGRDLLAFMLTQVAAPDPDATLGAGAVPPASAVAHLLLADAFDAPLAGADGDVGHRVGPAVIVIGSVSTPDTSMRVDIDVVSNDRRVLVQGGAGEPVVAPDAAMLRGVWETVAERDALRGSEGATRTAAADIVGPYAVVQPGGEHALASFALDGDVRHSLEADLERGFVVLVPSHGDGAVVGWWRVDPVFGTTLGVAADGRGQAMTEYEIKAYDAMYTVLFALKGLLDCQRKVGIAQVCCLMKAHLNNLMGLGFGGAVGSLAGSAAGLAFTLVSGFGNADFAGAITMICP